MPTYQYHCRKCGHDLEELQSITAAPLVKCPKCHTDNLIRVMGGGAGLIFKGSGFYLTDYKKTDKGQKGKGKKSGPGKSEPGPKPGE